MPQTWQAMPACAVTGYLAGLGPAYAAKTWRSLASDWACFARWCAENAEAAFPAGPATVIDYMEAQAADHSLATIQRQSAHLSPLIDETSVPTPVRADGRAAWKTNRG